MRRLLDLLIMVSLAGVALLVWAGQQRPPDRYLEKIKSAGVLRVGVDPTYPPFEMVKDGNVQGYDADLARAIAADLGVKTEFHTLALDTLYDALAADKVDILISALPFVYERQADVRYSTPYYQAGQVIIVRSDDSHIASLADLHDKTVGVELGSAADTEARCLARAAVPSMQVRSDYHSADEAMTALLDRQVEAAITDNVSAQTFGSAHPRQLSILSPPITDEPYVIAMPVQATGLSASVDATITRLRSSGELAKMMGLATP
jgi:ABC-type amino acid transport substrate-binding protein